MTGSEHYREAERLLAQATEREPREPGELTRQRTDLASAHVHATLALAAATALPEPPSASTSALGPTAWQRAAGGAQRASERTSA
jgi:hypothetical protein